MGRREAVARKVRVRARRVSMLGGAERARGGEMATSCGLVVGEWWWSCCCVRRCFGPVGSVTTGTLVRVTAEFVVHGMAASFDPHFDIALSYFCLLPYF